MISLNGIRDGVINFFSSSPPHTLPTPSASNLADKLKSMPQTITSIQKTVRDVPAQINFTVRRSFVDVPEELRALSAALPPPNETFKNKHLQQVKQVLTQQEVPHDKERLRARFDKLSDGDASQLEAFLECILLPVTEDPIPDEETEDSVAHDMAQAPAQTPEQALDDLLKLCIPRMVDIQSLLPHVVSILKNYGVEKEESIPRLVSTKLGEQINSRVPEALKTARTALSLVCGLPPSTPSEECQKHWNALQKALRAFSLDKVFHRLSFRNQNKVFGLLKSNPITLESVKGDLADVLACVSHLAERKCGLQEDTFDNFSFHARRVINGAPPHLRKAKSALIEARNAFPQATGIADRRRLIQVLIRPLEMLTQDFVALSYIPPKEQHFFFDLLDLLKLTERQEALLHTPRNILILLDPATNSAIEACTEGQGLLEEGVDTLKAKVSEIWSASSSSQGSDTVGFFMKKGEEILQLLMAKAESTLSRCITRSLATILNLIYSFLAEHFKSSSGNKNLRAEFTACRIVEELRPRMRAVQEAQESGDFSIIIRSLQQCFAIFRKYDTYIQGIHLPVKLHSHASPLPKLHELMKTHEEALALPAKSAPPNVQQTASRLKQRCSGFLTMLLVSKVCALRFEESAFPGFLSVESLRLTAYSQEFRIRFNNGVEHAQGYWFCKWAAKRLYPLVHHCVSFYINSAVNGIVHDFYQWKDRSNLLTRGQNIIQEIANYFAVLVDIQQSVANTPIGSGEGIRNLFQRELERPNAVRNGNLTQEQFYPGIIKAFTKKYMQFQWIETLENYFNQQLLPPTSRLAFLIPALDVMSCITKITLQGLLYFPQRFANAAHHLGISLLLWIYKDTIVHLVDDHMEHYSNPLTSTSLTVHKIIARKLTQVIELVHARFNGVTGEGSPLSINREQEEVMQGDIGGCINVLLEFLKHNRYDTTLSLKRYTDKDLTLEERAEREVDAFFLPRAMPGVAVTLWTALQGFLSNEDLEQLFDTGLTVCDYYFDPHTDVPNNAFDTTHSAITSSIDELLHSMLFYLINGHLDGTHGKQQEELTQFIASLKRQTTEFIQTIGLHIDRIATNNNPEEQTQIAREIATTSMDFIKARINVLGKSADGNPSLQEETKKMLNELLEEFYRAIAPLSEKINGQLLLHQEIDNHLRTATASAAAGHVIDAIEHSLCKPTLSQSDFAEASTQFAHLATHMADINGCTKEEMLKNDLNLVHHQLTRIFARIKTTQDLAAAQGELRNVKGRMSYQFRGLEAFSRQCALQERESSKQVRVDLRQSLAHLREWENRVEDITLYNIVIIDHMEWVRKWITSLAMWRIESIVGQLRGAFLKRYPYQLLIQLVGLDYLRAHGLRREL